MTAEELREYLNQIGVSFKEAPAAYGIRFECAAGEIFTVYQSGKINKQGKPTELTKTIEAWEAGSVPMLALRKVFIVYGHDEAARNDLELIIRRMGLEPVILCNLPCAGDTIIEKLEQYLGEHGKLSYACVIVTPDDEGHRIGHAEEKRPRARQNVVLELGMVLTRLGRKNVAILIKEEVEEPSDIGGLLYIPFRKSVTEAKAKLFQNLTNAGFKLNTDALA